MDGFKVVKVMETIKIIDLIVTATGKLPLVDNRSLWPWTVVRDHRLLFVNPNLFGYNLLR